ncbi:hypothetical protein OOK27_10565 [Streptomyces canus]|uniref:hypothetical protein n=1 Tax=Streptomyces canus TaxID=58343 RepID=UPI002259F4F1|nr:hypothetical protein [Streptomyces canus]MCX5254620.1 hypothetical protein [Streptomyces canus]
MPHVEPAHLMELALGNDISSNDPGALQHIAACNRCREELRQITRVVVSARGVEESDLPAAPPERVWHHITQELSATEKTPAPPPVKWAHGLHGRTIRCALGFLAGIAFVRWWSRGRHAPWQH